MKKKIRVKFNSLKQGDCFRITLKGPVYMKDNYTNGQVILGKSLGRVWLRPYGHNTLVYQINVNIVEVK